MAGGNVRYEALRDRSDYGKIPSGVGHLQNELLPR